MRCNLITFEALRTNYPQWDQIPGGPSCPPTNAGGVIPHPVNNPDYEHQCAIRMSIALLGADPNFFDDLRGGLLPSTHYSLPNRGGARVTLPYVRGALQLALHIRQRWGGPIIRNSTSAALTYINSNCLRGIIFYSVPAGSGVSHIDLWDAHCSLLYPPAGPQARRTMTWIAPNASEVWFWPAP